MRRRNLDWEKIRRSVEASAASNPGLIGPFLPPAPSPEWHRYILCRPFPERLNFRSVEVVLEIANTSFGWWVFQARKLTPPDSEPFSLCTNSFSRGHLERDLFQNGFFHQEGSAPARMMDCLVRLGYAHVMPAPSK